MKLGYGTSPEYDEKVSERLLALWFAATGHSSRDIFFAFYSAGKLGYKLEDLTTENLDKLIRG